MSTQHDNSRRLQLVASCFALSLLAACSDSIGPVQAAPVEEVEAPAAIEYGDPDAKRVLERAEARWSLIVEAKDNQERWVEVYKFLAPDVRDEYPITAYLPTKVKFHYDQPTKPKLLKIEGDHGYLSTSATWLAYRNPDVAAADGGANLVKPFESIEEWHWVEGEWYLFQPHRVGEFHKANPDFFTRKAPPESK